MTTPLTPFPNLTPCDTESPDRLALQRALETRYDGPIPVGASVPPDYAEPLHIQWRTRRDGAWREVRRLGHLIIAERHTFAINYDVTRQYEIARLRANLKYAVRSWAAFRGLHRTALTDLERRQAESSTEQAKALGRLVRVGGKR